jgi:hypothetical protein
MGTFGSRLSDYSPQMEAFESSPTPRFASAPGGVFSEDEETELASELLELVDEQELDHFLGDLIKKAGSAIGSFVKSPAIKAIGGVLKGVAKTALPIAGSALGGIVGGPVGAMLGGNLASMAGSALGLELEGLSPEDREFEAARQFVRFASATVKNALEAPPGADPQAAAYDAAVQAAQVHAPGLMNIGVESANRPGRRRGMGRWIRHGGKIILLGV